MALLALTSERLAVIKQWQADNLHDLNTADNALDAAYFEGQKAAYELIIEALRGEFDQ